MHPSDSPRRAGAPRAWADALAAAVGTLLAMAAVAALGLWLALSGTLPGGAFPAVVAATVLMAVGVPVRMDAGAGFLASAQGGISALPLSVTLVGALVMAALLLRPLRLRAVVAPRELAALAGRTAVFWLGLLSLTGLLARHTFTVSTGDPLVDELGGAIGAAPTVGFRTDPGPTVGYGALWLVVVLAATFAVSRRAPLPPAVLRYRTAVQPAAHAVVALLLVYVGLGVIAGLVTAAVGGHARDTLAVVLLALPNLAWLALGMGLGASWHGHAAGGIGLPMPKALASVLQTSGSRNVTLNLPELAKQDGRAWLLLALAVVLVLIAGLGAALRSPGDVSPRWHAAHLAVALAVAMLLIGALTRITAAYGLSLLGLGGTAGVSLGPDLLVAVPLAALWGAVAGWLGGVAARRLRPAR